MKKIIEWNIRHGGGKRTPHIISRLQKQNPDIIVLAEFRNNAYGALIKKELASKGYTEQVHGIAMSRVNTVLVASKVRIESSSYFFELKEHKQRLIGLKFNDFNMIVFYFPTGKRKIPVFDFLLRLIRDCLNEPTILIGDLNTGKHFIDEEGKTFKVPFYIEKIENAGWIDAWRFFHVSEREYTWYSTKGNGFRLDHAFVSPKMLEKLRMVYYSHSERTEGLSDHSALVVEFE